MGCSILQDKIGPTTPLVQSKNEYLFKGGPETTSATLPQEKTRFFVAAF